MWVWWRYKNKIEKYYNHDEEQQLNFYKKSTYQNLWAEQKYGYSWNDFFLIQRTEAVVRRYSVKKVFLEISQNSQENTCVRDSFLIKFQVWSTPFFTEHLRWLLLSVEQKLEEAGSERIPICLFDKNRTEENVNDTHREKLMLYSIQYKNSLKYKVGCFWLFSYVYTIS